MKILNSWKENTKIKELLGFLSLLKNNFSSYLLSY